MSYIYIQLTGEFLLDGELLATGYSGIGEGKNNPAMEGIVDVGPIPQGSFRITELWNSPTLGPDACQLEPEPGTNTFGRSGFYIHGDSIQHPGLASHGCIILPPGIRQKLKIGDCITVIGTVPAPLNLVVTDSLEIKDKVAS
jgi:Protein of unknown function (DUF2778)